jgi:hypothetical protein
MPLIGSPMYCFTQGVGDLVRHSQVSIHHNGITQWYHPAE